MLKRVISIIILLCLIFSTSVMAENENIATENFVPETSEENAKEFPQGGRGNMGMPPSGDMQGRTPPTMPNGEMPPEGMNRGQKPSGNFVPPENPGEVASTQNNNVSDKTETAVPQTENTESAPNPPMPDGNQQFGGQMPDGMDGFFGNIQNFSGQTQEEQPKGFGEFVKTYSTPITSLILLGLAFVFVVFYRRKNY